MTKLSWSTILKPKIYIILILLSLVLLFLHNKLQPSSSSKKQLPTPPITQEPFSTYTLPKIPSKAFYRIVMVGDSMTEVLGIHGGKLSEDLNTLYQSTPGHQRILIDNYAKGSTNIEELSSELTRKDL